MYDIALKKHIEFNSVRTISGSSSSVDTPINFDALAVISSTANLETEVSKLNAKIKAAKAFQTVMNDIRDGHSELNLEAKRGFNKKQAVRIGLKYAPSIQTSYDDIIKAFD